MIKSSAAIDDRLNIGIASFQKCLFKIIIGGISGICDFRRIPINVKYLECKISEVVTKKVEYLEYFFRIDSLSCVIYPE